MAATRPKITKKASFAGTFRRISAGESATYRCETLGLYPSACVAVWRLNKAAGYIEYEIETPNNGITYTVTRNPPLRDKGTPHSGLFGPVTLLIQK